MKKSDIILLILAGIVLVFLIGFFLFDFDENLDEQGKFCWGSCDKEIKYYWQPRYWNGSDLIIDRVEVTEICWQDLRWMYTIGYDDFKEIKNKCAVSETKQKGGEK